LHEVGKVFMCFFISKLFGMVAAAIQSNVDCEDYISHLIPLTFVRPPGGWPVFNDICVHHSDGGCPSLRSLQEPALSLSKGWGRCCRRNFCPFYTNPAAMRSWYPPFAKNTKDGAPAKYWLMSSPFSDGGYIDLVRGLAKSAKRGEFLYYWRISAATSSPNFFWISFWVSGSKSVRSNIRRTSTISLSFPGIREAHSSASSRDFTWMIQ